MSNVEGKWMAKGDEKVGENADNNAGNIQTVKTSHWQQIVFDVCFSEGICVMLRILKNNVLIIINIWAAKLGDYEQK
jgi:hypothetical protein